MRVGLKFQTWEPFDVSLDCMHLGKATLEDFIVD